MAANGNSRQDELRDRIRAILRHGRLRGGYVRSLLLRAGYNEWQIDDARDAIVRCYGRGSHVVWSLNDGGVADLPIGPPAPERKRPPVTRHLLRCSCGFHIGYRAEGEPRLCLLCQERAA